MFKQWVGQWVRRIGVFVLFGLIISAASLIAFAALADEIGEQDTLAHFDLALANALHDQIQPGQVTFFIVVSLFGYQFLYTWSALFALGLLLRKRRADLALWLTALAGGVLLNQLLKVLFVRPRPFFIEPIFSEANYSFPSGHAMLSLIAYGLAAYLIAVRIHSITARTLIGFLAVLVIVVIGISRMYLGAHYFSDVIGGFIAGTMWLATCITAREVLRRRGLAEGVTSA